MATRPRISRIRTDKTRELSLPSYAPRRLRVSGCRDSADQVLLLGFAFGSDGKGVEHAQRQGIFQRLVLPPAQVALTQNFHSDNSFSGSLHFAKHAHHRVRIGV